MIENKQIKQRRTELLKRLELAKIKQLEIRMQLIELQNKLLEKTLQNFG